MPCHISNCAVQRMMLALIILSCGLSQARAQESDSVVQITDQYELMVGVGGSVRLEFEYRIPESTVDDPNIIDAAPVSPSEFVIRGLRAGTTELTVSNEDGEQQTLLVHVDVNTTAFRSAVCTEFPNSKLHVHSRGPFVFLSGEVVPPDSLEDIRKIGRECDISNLIIEARPWSPLGLQYRVMFVPTEHFEAHLKEHLEIHDRANGGDTKMANEEIFMTSGSATDIFMEKLQQLKDAKRVHGNVSGFLQPRTPSPADFLGNNMSDLFGGRTKHVFEAGEKAMFELAASCDDHHRNTRVELQIRINGTGEMNSPKTEGEDRQTDQVPAEPRQAVPKRVLLAKSTETIPTGQSVVAFVNIPERQKEASTAQGETLVVMLESYRRKKPVVKR